MKKRLLRTFFADGLSHNETKKLLNNLTSDETQELIEIAKERIKTDKEKLNNIDDPQEKQKLQEEINKLEINTQNMDDNISMLKNKIDSNDYIWDNALEIISSVLTIIIILGGIVNLFRGNIPGTIGGLIAAFWTAPKAAQAKIVGTIMKQFNDLYVNVKSLIQKKDEIIND